MKILVTGSAGFIGSHTVRRLTQDGHEIVGIDNLNNYYDVNLKLDRLESLSALPRFRFQKLDISNRPDVESLFDAYRLEADVQSADGMYGVPVEAFANGGNDIVLFTGVTWSEPAGAVRAEGLTENSVMHFSGHPGQLSDTAEVVCVTTDAFVIAAADGSGMLIRTGLRPGSVEVERNPEKVRAFLVDRGYSAG